MKIKILIVAGTRPEAIKTAPLYLTLKKHPLIRVRFCAAGQHNALLNQALGFFKIRPDYHLKIMSEDQDLFDITEKVIRSMKKVLFHFLPHYVFVQGDTAAAFTAALASFYMKIPVCHIEAGLRTHNIRNPFPEEMNRRLITQLSTYHFAPTASARKNLLSEKVPDKNILITGNTGIDALVWMKKRMAAEKDIDVIRLKKMMGYQEKGRIILVTAHRRENHGKRLNNLCLGLRMLAKEHPDIRIIYPVHPNPNVRNKVRALLSGLKNVRLWDPLPYRSFIWLMKRAFLIITDSGGIQEEAPALGIPVLVFREETERTEALKAGTARLIGTETKGVLKETNRLLSSPALHQRMSRPLNPYGDGKACSRIVRFILTAGSGSARNKRNKEAR